MHELGHWLKRVKPLRPFPNYSNFFILGEACAGNEGKTKGKENELHRNCILYIYIYNY
jgi:hypothetical protein